MNRVPGAISIVSDVAEPEVSVAVAPPEVPLIVSVLPGKLAEATIAVPLLAGVGLPPVTSVVGNPVYDKKESLWNPISVL